MRKNILGILLLVLSCVWMYGCEKEEVGRGEVEAGEIWEQTSISRPRENILRIKYDYDAPGECNDIDVSYLVYLPDSENFESTEGVFSIVTPYGGTSFGVGRGKIPSRREDCFRENTHDLYLLDRENCELLVEWRVMLNLDELVPRLVKSPLPLPLSHHVLLSE